MYLTRNRLVQLTDQTPDEIPNLYASRIWKKKVSEHAEFKKNFRNMVLLGSTDGFNTSKKRVHTDVWPVAVKCLNLPEYEANLAENIGLISVCDFGKPKTFQGYNKLFIAELLDGWHDGYEVYDAHSDTTATVKVQLLGWTGDMPGSGLVSCQSVRNNMFSMQTI